MPDMKIKLGISNGINVGVLGTRKGGGAAPTYSISGTVYDADGSTAVASATVALGALTATSAANGTYTISDVPAGTSGSMTCTKANYNWAAISVSAMAGNLTGQNYTANNYASILQKVYGASELWPLVDVLAGTTILAKVNAARNGTLTGWDLQNAAGPVTGTLAPYFDDTNDSGTVQTASLTSLFNGATGSVFVWLKADFAWNDNVERQFVRFLVDGNNYVILERNNANSQFRYLYNAGGTLESVIDTSAPTAWFSAGMSWDRTAGADGEMKAFMNGAQTGATQTSLGTWSGNIIQSFLGYDGNRWKGLAAYAAVKFGSVWTPTDFANMHNAAATAGPENP